MPENIHGSSSFPLQPTLPPLIHQRHPSCEPHIPVKGNVPPRVHHPNWQPHAPTPAIIPTFGKASQLVDHVNNLENNLEKPRRNQDKSRCDPIPVKYTELFPRLLERQLVALSHVPITRPPFPKSYNPNVHCDYHAGNPRHSTEDCISLKQKVQTLIEVGNINFGSSDQPSDLLSNFFGQRQKKLNRIFRPQRMKKLLPLVEEFKKEGLDIQLRRQRKRRKPRNFKRRMKSSDV